jgi:hypothetical protein
VNATRKHPDLLPPASAWRYKTCQPGRYGRDTSCRRRQVVGAADPAHRCLVHPESARAAAPAAVIGDLLAKVPLDIGKLE